MLAARRDGDRFFCLEQPDRDGFALAGLGAAAAVEESGRERFGESARRIRALASRTIADDPGRDPDRPPAAGPVFVGGFAFAPDGGGSPEWSSLRSRRSWCMPEVSLARYGDEARLTLAVAADGAEDPHALVERGLARLAGMSPRHHAAARPRSAGARPRWPARPRRRTTRGRWRAPWSGSAAGELSKLVLAREVRVHGTADHEPGAILDALRVAFPACYCYCVGTPELAFVGASPELLVRRDGARAQTVALAGTTRRSADPSVDDHLGEQLLPEPEGPGGTGDRGAPDRAHARAGQPVGGRRRRAGPGEGAERAAPGHADPGPAGPARCTRSSWPACSTPPPRWEASRARWPSR